MVDLKFRKLLGHRMAWALALALLTVALCIPAGAQAATPAVAPALAEVPVAAQAAVNAALAQASPVDAPSVAAAPAPVPSAPSAAAQMPATVVQLPSRPSTPVVTPPVVQVNTSASAVPTSASPRPDAAPATVSFRPPRPMRALSGGAGPRPSGRVRHLAVPHRAVGRGQRHVFAPPIELVGVTHAAAPTREWTGPARTHRVATDVVAVGASRRIAAPHRGHQPSTTASAAGAIAPVSPSVPASLPPGGAGSAGAGAGSGPAGAAAVALLALAAVALLRTLLPGLMTLDLLPWRSAVLASPPDRPG